MSDYDDSDDQRAFYGETAKKDDGKQVKIEQDYDPNEKSKRKKQSKKKRRQKSISTRVRKTDKISNLQRNEGEKKADQIIMKMKDVYKQDEMLLKNGGLANKKIIFCRELEKELRNVFVCEGFLQLGGLSILVHWLTKPENGMQPSLTLKLKLFKIIHELKVNENHLSEASDLQIILHKNQKSILKQLRDLSEAIILKWGKIAYNDIN